MKGIERKRKAEEILTLFLWLFINLRRYWSIYVFHLFMYIFIIYSRDYPFIYVLLYQYWFIQICTYIIFSLCNNSLIYVLYIFIYPFMWIFIYLCTYLSLYLCEFFFYLFTYLPIRCENPSRIFPTFPAPKGSKREKKDWRHSNS